MEKSPSKKKETELERCKRERSEYLAGWQRAKADFINYKKEEESRKAEIIKFSNEVLIKELLQILDSFDLAFESTQDKGVFLIRSQLFDVLKNYGLSEIRAEGEKFSPAFHEAVDEVESDKESGTVIEVVRRGYMLYEKVIRPARVKVAK